MVNFDEFDIEEVKQGKGITALKNISPDFYDFLISYNSSQEWVKNLENDKSPLVELDTHNDVLYFLKNNGRYRYISNAFHWQNTPEGWYFWNRLNKIWILLVRYKK